MSRPVHVALIGVGLSGALQHQADYQGVLAHPELEALVIASPGATHHGLVAAAAEAGPHVLCQRPLAYEREGADQS